jgi:hypothetical protein
VRTYSLRFLGPRSKAKGGTFYIFFIALLVAILLGAVTAQSPPAIVINELQYNPASDDAGEEYVELYNAGAQAVDLTGVSFSDGIVYTFPTNTLALPGGYLVVAHDPAAVEARYGITGVLGPFEDGNLSNSGERVALQDADGLLLDEVDYDDNLPWPTAPDGDGPSLELVNPAFDNDSPCSWGGSSGLGTPGAQNSVYQTGNIPPCITGAAHSPTFPRSTDVVTVTALVYDNGAALTVTLHYRPQGDVAYRALPMLDDGSGEYSALIPARSLTETLFPQPGQGTYVEFYLSATDDQGAQSIAPVGAPGGVSTETGLPLTTSYLYWVEDAPPESELSIYRLILTDENRRELETRDIFSDELLDAAFVYEDKVFYNVGLRYRGESSRDMFPRPYRIKFDDAQEFQGRERINLLSDELGREALAYDLFQRAGFLAPDTRFVSFYLNGQREGDYLDVEQVDRDFLQEHLGDDDNGNLYRGVDGADLGYRGPNPGDYAPNYVKQTNEEQNDYTDVISLTYALTHAPDESLRAELEALADARQWLEWFAVQAVLDNHEGALWLGSGDDYFLYRRPSDERFVLISWDHDGTFMFPDHTVWEPDWYASQAVRRILHHPEFTRWYYQGIAGLISGPLSVAEMQPRIEALPDAVSQADKAKFSAYVAARVPYLWTEIPATSLSISTNGGQDIVTTQEQVTLEGNCSPLRDVSVNGAAVQYPTATTWRYTSSLWARDNVFVVSDGQASRTITVFRDVFHGGVLTEDATLQSSKLPYVISTDISLSGPLTLTIQPGVTLYFEPDRVIRVENGARLLAEGTAEQPIVFTGQGGAYWGGILFYNTQADNRIAHALLEYIHEVIQTPRTHGVSGYGARFTISDSVIRHTRQSNAVLASDDSTLYLLRNELYDVGSDAVHATGGYAYIQGNIIHDTVYEPAWNPSPPEGIEISNMSTPAVLLDNHIYNVSDDCLDLNHSSARIERNVLHHCGDKGISIGYPSTSTLVNNLIYACWGSDQDPDNTGFGIALKDGASASIVNNTLVDNRHGLGLYEMHAGQGGASASVVNSIVWGNQSNIELRDGSVVTMSHSTIQGGWPGVGSLQLDPLFRNWAGQDYRLQENSPCVDSGTPDGAPQVDVQGIPRPHGEGYDRGAYEFFEFFSVYLPLLTSR